MAGTETTDKKVTRKCSVKDRTGDFFLERHTLKMSKVWPLDENGQISGPSEDLDTDKVYNIRMMLPPARHVTRASAEVVYPADRPRRRLCTLKDREGEFHLIRKGADAIKVLKVGEAGTGTWVANHLVKETYAAPLPIKARVGAAQKIRVVERTDRPGEKFLLLRTTTKGARVIGPVRDDNYGETIDPALLINQTDLVIKKGKLVNLADENKATEGQSQETPVVENQAVTTSEVVAPAAPVQAQVAPRAPQQVPRQQPGAAPRPQGQVPQRAPQQVPQQVPQQAR